MPAYALQAQSKCHTLLADDASTHSAGSAAQGTAATLDPQGRVQFGGDSDSELTRGLCALLVQGLSGLTPEEVLQVRPQWHTMAVHVHMAAGV